MFIGAVYLFQSNCGNCLKQVFFIIYATILFSGCGSYLNSEKPSPEKIINIKKIKNQIIKKLSFLPYINYVPSIKPTVYGTILLKELYLYEDIVDDHIQYGRVNVFEKTNVKKKGLFNKISPKKLFKKKQNESIEEKISDINTIRKLTSRYEDWSLGWDAKANTVKNNLSLDEIALIQSEIKRISRKL